jgi:undecaprenyl diphosphate synthase
MMSKGKMPGHVAIIMDGNGRWAKARGLPRIAGHRAGVRTVRAIVRAAAKAGLRYLTLYAFSEDNRLRRPPREVRALMGLLAQYLRLEFREMMEQGIRLRAIGRLGGLPGTVRRALREVIGRTARNPGLTLTLALNYSSRQELADAARRLARAGAPRGRDALRRFLYDPGLPDPDLVIRTSGEMRLSDFLLWQAAYAELWFTPRRWPEFTPADLMRALRAFASRERRYGGVEARAEA